MRWRAFYFEKDLKNEHTNKPYNMNVNNSKLNKVGRLPFPTNKSAPVCLKLIPFETELFELINSIDFKNNITKFQKNLRNDLKSIKKSDKLIVFADKTNNLYKIKANNYNKLLNDAITKDYKKCDNNSVDLINSCAQNILNINNISGKRIPKLNVSKSYITIKDHKDNFPATIKSRLINTSKTSIGKISKLILSSIIKDVRTATGLTQWKNTGELLKWFSALEDRHNKRFVSFDIVEFYPSITKKHLLDSLEYASNFSNFSQSDINIILHSCDSLLFSDNCVWKKKNNDGFFDVPMGSFHGAEICDLVGLYILSKLKNVFNNLGLYRDDSLGVLDLAKPVVYDKIRKQTFKIMSDIGFKITLDIGKQVTNFLDVTLNLSDGTFRPYRKPNSLINFININSDHPKHIKKALPIMTQKRLSCLSSNAKIFNEIKAPYENMLNNNGFKCKLSYETNDNKVKKRNKSRNNRVLWYNPPYCSNINLNLGKEYLKLVDKHFTTNHIYRKIFNRKTLKISYSCMNNVKSIIQSHNNFILSKYNTNTNTNNNNVKNCDIYKNINKSIDHKLKPTSRTCNKVDCTTSNSNKNNNSIYNNKNNIIDNNEISNRPITRSITRNKKQTSSNIINLSTNDYLNNEQKDKPSTTTKIITLPTNINANNNCNCRKANKINCPLQGNCLIKNVVYKVNVKCNNNSSDKIYIGSTGRHFKDRYTGHKYTFNHINKKNSTRLSDFVWHYFSRYGRKPDMEWSIVHHVKGNIGGASKICQLCNLERLAIAAEDKHQLLNRRQDMSNNCAHNRRFFFN